MEEAVGKPLLDRHHQRPVTTEAGERLLGYARRLLALGAEAREAMGESTHQEVIRIGVPEDLGGRALTPMLADFSRNHGQRVRLEVTSGLSNDLVARHARGEFELILAKQRQPGGVRSWPEQLAWVDSRRFPCLERDPLPLVVFPEGGLYRDEIFGWLDAHHRKWQVIYSSPNLANLLAAVGDGLGISLLPARAVDAAIHRPLDATNGFATPAALWLNLHHPAGSSAASLELAHRLAQTCDQLTGRNGAAPT